MEKFADTRKCSADEKRFDGFVIHSAYMTLKNGIRLAYDVCIPTLDGVETKEPLPLILHYTPYGRRRYTGRLTEDGKRETVPSDMDGWTKLTAYGYIFATVECRGTGASFGVRKIVNSREEAAEGAEALDWLAGQPFCNGRVGTVGASYNGQTQLEMLSCCPKHIKACFIGMTDFNKFDGWIRNGVPRAFGSKPDTDWGNTPEELAAAIDREVNNTVPVDGDENKVLLREAVTEHTKNGEQVAAMRDFNWRDCVDEYSGYKCWTDLSASTYKDKINSTGAAIYLLGGIYDVFRRDTFVIYHNLTLPKKLLWGPWYHVSPKIEPNWGDEGKRWFDYWLKGIDNGIMDEKPITMRVGNYNFETGKHTGEGTGYYRTSDTWPLHEGERYTFYPAAGENNLNGQLGRLASGEHKLSYKGAYGIKTSKESAFTVMPDGSGLDQLGAVFTSEPAVKDMVFTGHPMAHVRFTLDDAGWMEGGKPDADIFVTLSDYDPETDKAFIISDGHLRSSMRNSGGEAPYDFLGLPWHRCLIGDNEYLEKGGEYTLDFDLMPLSYCIKKGHCLRMTLSISMDRMYYHGRIAYEENNGIKPPVLSFILGGENGTRLVMPDIFAGQDLSSR